LPPSHQSEFLQLPSNQFLAVGADECPAGSRCEGYQLGGSYGMGSASGATITSAEGD